MQRDQLQQERETLVRNISCLFKTAQLELERKEGELRELRRDKIVGAARPQELPLPPPPPRR